MGVRIEKEILYLRVDFTTEEKMKMADDLARAYNRNAEIDDEEAVMKAQIKDKRSAVTQTIGTLSRGNNIPE